MSTALAVDRSRVCTFTFGNGCQCRIPLSPSHPYLCTFHARKEIQCRDAEKVADKIAFDLSGNYISFCDLSSALAHTVAAVAQRHIPTRTAATIAYLTQNLVQSVAGAQKEYIDTFGKQVWRDTVAHNFDAPRPGENSGQDSGEDSHQDSDEVHDEAPDEVPGEVPGDDPDDHPGDHPANTFDQTS